MGEEEPIGYEERRAIALETTLPRHFSGTGVISVDDVVRGQIATLVRACIGKFPSAVVNTADNGLATECPDCHQSFVWTDRIYGWTAT